VRFSLRRHWRIEYKKEKLFLISSPKVPSNQTFIIEPLKNNQLNLPRGKKQ
jgi:hypothetical protein